MNNLNFLRNLIKLTFAILWFYYVILTAYFAFCFRQTNILQCLHLLITNSNENSIENILEHAYNAYPIKQRIYNKMHKQQLNTTHKKLNYFSSVRDYCLLLDNNFQTSTITHKKLTYFWKFESLVYHSMTIIKFVQLFYNNLEQRYISGRINSIT